VSLGCGVTLLLLAELCCDGDELGNADGASDGELTGLGSFEFDPGDPDGRVVGTSVSLLLAGVFCDGDELGNADGASDGELTGLGSFDFDSGDPDGRVVGTSVSIPPVLGALLGLEEDITVEVGSTVAAGGACVGGGSVIPKLEHSAGTPGQKT
jgi:hypothetical protein